MVLFSTDIDTLQTRALTEACQPSKHDVLHACSWNEKADLNNLKMLSELPQTSIQLEAIDIVPGSLKKTTYLQKMLDTQGDNL